MTEAATTRLESSLFGCANYNYEIQTKHFPQNKKAVNLHWSTAFTFLKISLLGNLRLQH